MPIYDYVCGACRHRFEVLHGLNESGPRQCPICEGPVSRAYAPPTIVFKGSGWAKVDRRATRAPRRSGGGTEPAPSGSTSSASSESTGSTESSGAAPSAPSTAAAPGASNGPKPD